MELAQKLGVYAVYNTTFPEICNGRLFRSILTTCVQNWKFVVLPVHEIMGLLQNFWQSLDTPMLLFLPHFRGCFARMDPVNISAKFEVRSFIRSWDNSDFSFGVGLHTPNLGEGEAVGGRDGTVRKSVCGVHRPSIVTFPYAFQGYCCFYAPARHFFQPHL